MENTEDNVTISLFKATCLALLDRVKQTGRPLIITRRGEPIARVTPPPPPEMKSWLGVFRDRGSIAEEIVSPAVHEKEWEVLQ